MKQPVWIVEDVKARNDYTLLITFTGGAQRIFDARPLLDKPIFAPLKSLPFFLRAKAMYGTVIWNDNVDIAPEHLYECSTPVEVEKISCLLCKEVFFISANIRTHKRGNRCIHARTAFPIRGYTLFLYFLL